MEDYPHLSFTKRWEVAPESHYRLGECEAMIWVIANTPLRPKDHNRLLQVSLIKGAQATTAIEGNTLSREEIERIYLENEKLPASREYLQIEVTNVIEAFNFLLDAVVRKSKEWPVTPELILEFHKMITKGLGDHIDAIPGRWRDDRRQVGPYLAPEHRYVPELIGRLCAWIRDEFHFHKQQDFVTAVIQAIVTHVYIEWIHPFADGNGRTGRLVEFYILLRAGLPVIASHILSDFYNQTRTEYYRQLNIARQERDLTKFLNYAIHGFRDGLAAQLAVIQNGQMKTFWRNHVFESFADIHYRKSTVFKRKRGLMLAMPIDCKLTVAEILAADPKIAREYAALTPSVLARDLKDLMRMKLLLKKGQYYRANNRELLAHLPEKKG